MPKKPPRPIPSYLIDDYDDGDPYACIAAGSAEHSMEQSTLRQVEACFGQAGPLEAHGNSLANIKTALYDIWLRDRSSEQSLAKADWAAEQMAILGDSSLLDYDRQERGLVKEE